MHGLHLLLREWLRADRTERVRPPRLRSIELLADVREERSTFVRDLRSNVTSHADNPRTRDDQLHPLLWLVDIHNACVKETIRRSAEGNGGETEDGGRNRCGFLLSVDLCARKASRPIGCQNDASLVYASFMVASVSDRRDASLGDNTIDDAAARLCR